MSHFTLNPHNQHKISLQCHSCFCGADLRWSGSLPTNGTKLLAGLSVNWLSTSQSKGSSRDVMLACLHCW